MLEELDGIAIDARDAKGVVALHHAALCNHTRTIEVLLEFGARTDIRDKTDRTPLEVAEQDESIEAMTLIHKIMRAKVDLPPRPHTDLTIGDIPLWAAARLGKVDLIQLTIDKAGVNATIELDRCSPHTRRNALWYAAEANDIQVITMLLKAGINNNHKDRTTKVYRRCLLQSTAAM